MQGKAQGREVGEAMLGAGGLGDGEDVLAAVLGAGGIAGLEGAEDLDLA